MIKTPVKSSSTACLSLFAAAALACISLPGYASKLTATAEIKGCTDASISGSATLTEEKTDEGIKEVTIHFKVEGLSDGKHAVHIHETAACEPCGACVNVHCASAACLRSSATIRGPFGLAHPLTPAVLT